VRRAEGLYPAGRMASGRDRLPVGPQAASLPHLAACISNELLWVFDGAPHGQPLLGRQPRAFPEGRSASGADLAYGIVRWEIFPMGMDPKRAGMLSIVAALLTPS
jgi:hypothetical protein